MDNAIGVRLGAAATILEQAAALARVGAVAEVEVLIGAARGLLTVRAEVVPLEVANVGKKR